MLCTRCSAHTETRKLKPLPPRRRPPAKSVPTPEPCPPRPPSDMFGAELVQWLNENPTHPEAPRLLQNLCRIAYEALQRARIYAIDRVPTRLHDMPIFLDDIFSGKRDKDFSNLRAVRTEIFDRFYWQRIYGYAEPAEVPSPDKTFRFRRKLASLP